MQASDKGVAEIWRNLDLGETAVRPWLDKAKSEPPPATASPPQAQIRAAPSFPHSWASLSEPPRRGQRLNSQKFLEFGAHLSAAPHNASPPIAASIPETSSNSGLPSVPKGPVAWRLSFVTARPRPSRLKSGRLSSLPEILLTDNYTGIQLPLPSVLGDDGLGGTIELGHTAWLEGPWPGPGGTFAPAVIGQ